MIYTHVLNRGGLGVRSPLDNLPATASPRRVSTGPHTPTISRTPAPKSGHDPW